ncbi:MAG: undecaprenyl-phosphate galactose phosphotransferase WbaP [Elusimicrobiales bacterium]
MKYKFLPLLNTTRIKKNIGIFLLFLFDIIALILLFQISVYVRAHLLPKIIANLPEFKHSISMYLWIFPIYIFSFLYEGLYHKTFPFWDEIKQMLKSFLIATIVILSVLFISKTSQKYSRILIITLTFLLAFLFPFIRINVRKLLYTIGLLRKKALIIGSGKLAQKIYLALKNEINLCYEIAGFIDDTSEKEVIGYKIHKGINNIERYIKSAHITDVIIAKENLTKNELQRLINTVQHKAQNVIYIPEIEGIAISGTEIKYFFYEQAFGIEIKNNLSNPIIYLTKRIIDYITAVIVTILLLPIFVIISILIKFDSKGPIIYSHKRVGKNGRYFNCYKFRTMYADADRRLKEILEKDPEKKKEWERFWKLKDDPRVTKLGKFLRKTSLDELPQIFNVLKGEMSLVGPRPVVQKEIDDYYKEDAQYYFKVPPGVTGLWQVSGRSNTSYEYRISLDSWYVKNWNLWLDIVILLKTVKAVIKKEGAC